jgi:hypothetical protein
MGKRKNNRAFIRYDKLYVNGIPWNPPPNVPDVFQQRNRPNPGPVICQMDISHFLSVDRNFVKIWWYNYSI